MPCVDTIAKTVKNRIEKKKKGKGNKERTMGGLISPFPAPRLFPFFPRETALFDIYPPPCFLIFFSRSKNETPRGRTDQDIR